MDRIEMKSTLAAINQWILQSQAQKNAMAFTYFRGFHEQVSAKGLSRPSAIRSGEPSMSLERR